MTINPMAGKIPLKSMLANIPQLISAYFTLTPDIKKAKERISFGTSGHRGSSLQRTFNEEHILAVTQAVCNYRQEAGINGPLFLGMDTHALSWPAQLTAIEVLTANKVNIYVAADFGYTPTPVISHAIITHNQGQDNLSDGIVITPSHNPPTDGGFKYNPPHGGPAGTRVTKEIETRANDILENNLAPVQRLSLREALASPVIQYYDYITPYVHDLANIIDMESIAQSQIHIGADALGGSGLAYYAAIKEYYGLNMEIFNDTLDSTFSFMHCDKDGKIRMDCSSPYAMAGLIALKNDFAIAFGNDTDFDRHGIVTASGGLMQPNHYLAVAINYLARNRPQWQKDLAIGKTLVSSSIIDRVTADLGKKIIEVPVGFKWFVDSFLAGTIFFGGEESAGASFLRKNGLVWTTDKDGIIMNLLAAEITAKTGRDPGEHYLELTKKFGTPYYERLDAPATTAQKESLLKLTPADVKIDTLGGEPITTILTNAPGNNAPMGGLKIIAPNGWFALRPSGTEDIYKIYAESFLDKSHLHTIQQQAIDMVKNLL